MCGTALPIAGRPRAMDDMPSFVLAPYESNQSQLAPRCVDARGGGKTLCRHNLADTPIFWLRFYQDRCGSVWLLMRPTTSSYHKRCRW